MSLLGLLGLLPQMSMAGTGDKPSPDLDNSDAAAGHRRDFETMDTNGDGMLDAIEVKTFYLEKFYLLN